MNEELLIGAVFEGDLEKVKFLVGNGCDPKKNHLLHSAAEMGHLHIVKYLIETLKIDFIDDFDEISYTPLTYAIKNNHLNVAQFLILNGASVNAHEVKMSGETPLGAVIGTASLEVVRFLINAGADPLIPGWMHITALDRAISRFRDDPSMESEEILLLVRGMK